MQLFLPHRLWAPPALNHAHGSLRAAGLVHAPAPPHSPHPQGRARASPSRRSGRGRSRRLAGADAAAGVPGRLRSQERRAAAVIGARAAPPDLSSALQSSGRQGCKGPAPGLPDLRKRADSFLLPGVQLRTQDKDADGTRPQDCVLRAQSAATKYVLEMKPKQDLGASTVGFWWEPFSGLQPASFSLCPHVAEREQESFLQSLYKGTNPIHEGFTLLRLGPPSSLQVRTPSSRGGGKGRLLKTPR
ncbi:uncharacterized protein LOC112659266 [Canis lupus dingo]|uniref:uncharacterized protein LOC112659266 n=1 Tax=Canis lupus dingo TaxID=286419 RepID=UPI000DC75010|nr:uncharacterized protein LOC112659266 [Canis lupus dingo]